MGRTQGLPLTPPLSVGVTTLVKALSSWPSQAFPQVALLHGSSRCPVCFTRTWYMHTMVDLFPIVLISVELTSVLVVIPSHRLRITVLLSFSYRETVEGLPNVDSSSTTQQWQNYLAGHVPHVGKVESIFVSEQLKKLFLHSIIWLFRYSVKVQSIFISRQLEKLFRYSAILLFHIRRFTDSHSWPSSASLGISAIIISSQLSARWEK